MEYNVMALCHISHLCSMSLSNIKTAWISWTYVVVLLLSVFLVAGKSLRTARPTLLSTPLSVTHQAGDIAILYCSITNLGEHTVTWRKIPSPAPLTIGTERWVKDKRLHAEHVPNSANWNLVIEDVRTQDRGQYECQVSHRKSPIRHRVTLHVTEKQEAQLPRIEISGENVIRAGTTLRLTCNATVVDVQIDKIIWVKDGNPVDLDNSNRYTIYTSMSVTGQRSGVISSVLEVKSAREQDGGVYLCKSTERAQMAGVTVEVQGNNKKREKQDELNLYNNGDSPLRETRDYHQTHSSSSSSSSKSSSSSSGNDPNNAATRRGVTVNLTTRTTTIFHYVNIMWVTALYLVVLHV